MEAPFAKSTLGAGAVIECDDRVLLVQLNYGVARGKWILPGGMVNVGESPSEAAAREVKEETGLDARIEDLIGVRHRRSEKGAANVYFVFRGRLALPLSECQRRLAWPVDELQCARFWPRHEALASEEVRPITRLYLRMAQDAPSRPAVSVPAELSSNDSVYR